MGGGALEGTDMASAGSVWLEGKERQAEPWPQVRLGDLVWETGSQQMQEANGKGYNPKSLLNENSCNGGLRDVPVGSLRWEVMVGMLAKCAPYEVWSACPLDDL